MRQSEPEEFRLAKRERWRALSRGCLCGYVDSYSLLRFGVYTSFMSGNTTAAGMSAGLAKVAKAAHSFLPIPFFLLGAFGGSLLQPKKAEGATFRVTVLVAALLAVSAMATWMAAPGWMCIALLGTAMGMLNTTLSHVGGQSVNLGFITGDLKNLGGQLADMVNRLPVAEPAGAWDTHGSRAATLVSVWSSFLTGAVLGAIGATRWGAGALLVPSLTLVLLAGAERKAGTKQGA